MTSTEYTLTYNIPVLLCSPRFLHLPGGDVVANISWKNKKVLSSNFDARSCEQIKLSDDRSVTLYASSTNIDGVSYLMSRGTKLGLSERNESNIAFRQNENYRIVFGDDCQLANNSMVRLSEIEAVRIK